MAAAYPHQDRNARLIYQVDTVVRIVAIKAIGKKRHNQLYIRGRKFKL